MQKLNLVNSPLFVFVLYIVFVFVRIIYEKIFVFVTYRNKNLNGDIVASLLHFYNWLTDDFAMSVALLAFISLFFAVFLNVFQRFPNLR